MTLYEYLLEVLKKAEAKNVRKALTKVERGQSTQRQVDAWRALQAKDVTPEEAQAHKDFYATHGYSSSPEHLAKLKSGKIDDETYRKAIDNLKKNPGKAWKTAHKNFKAQGINVPPVEKAIHKEMLRHIDNSPGLTQDIPPGGVSKELPVVDRSGSAGSTAPNTKYRGGSKNSGSSYGGGSSWGEGSGSSQGPNPNNSYRSSSGSSHSGYGNWWKRDYSREEGESTESWAERLRRQKAAEQAKKEAMWNAAKSELKHRAIVYGAIAGGTLALAGGIKLVKYLNAKKKARQRAAIRVREKEKVRVR